MTQRDFKNLLFSHPKANFDLLKSEWQIQKVCELIDIFKEEELEQLAFNISLDENNILEKQTLSVKTFCLFVKDFIETNAYYWALRSDFKEKNDLTNYEKTRLIKVFYIKKSLKKIPQWAQNIMY